MEIIDLSYPLPASSYTPVSLAIGFFDGVHLGHQTVIRQAIRQAEKFNTAPAVMTFHPHPREIVGHIKMESYITPKPEKLRQFAELGIEKAFIMKFDTKLAAIPKESFVNEVLIPLQVKSVATGYNFTFGRHASGRPQDMKRLGQGKFLAEMVEPVQTSTRLSSSTNIRQALLHGEIEEANQMLGRPYMLKGKVVQGDQRGRLMGFPTANLALEQPYFIPRRGVYIVQATYQEETVYGIMNIGYRPTFHDPEPRLHLEVHILEHKPNLYGQQLMIEFLCYLREERKFPSIEALQSQIQRDKEQAQRWLERLYLRK